jgi:3-oxoacyl-[acyl-carrier protein] reductase
MFNLTGRLALVTGASGGIGGAIAKALAEAGAKVALSGTRVEALEAAAKEIPNSVVVPCNLSDAAGSTPIPWFHLGRALWSLVGTVKKPA